MQKIHQKLLQKYPFYTKWHECPNHQVYHWFILLLILVGLTCGIIHINNLNNNPNQKQLSKASLLGNINPEMRIIPSFQDEVKGVAQNHILVKFKPNLNQGVRAQVLARHGLAEKEEIKQIGIKILNIPAVNYPQ